MDYENPSAGQFEPPPPPERLERQQARGRLNRLSAVLGLVGLVLVVWGRRSGLAAAVALWVIAVAQMAVDKKRRDLHESDAPNRWTSITR